MAHIRIQSDGSSDNPETLWPPPKLHPERVPHAQPDREEDDDQPAAVTKDDRVTSLVVASGSSFALFSGAVAVAVSVMGLAGYMPVGMAAIATIAVSFALLAQGSTVATRWREAIKIEGREHTDVFGIGTEMFGGLAGIVLGFLALVSIMPLTLLPAASIVLGFSLLLGAPAQPDIAEMDSSDSPRRWHVTRDAVRASSGVLVMAGLGAVVMGVLASIGIAPVVTISLVAVLCIAAALVMSGGTLFARFARRHP